MNELREAVGVDDVRQLDLKRLDSTPPNRLHVHYVATSSKEEQFTLTVVPTSIKRLRMEQSSIRSEAILLQWLSNSHSTSAADERGPNHKVPEQPVPDSIEENKLSPSISDFKNMLPRVIKHGRAKFPNDVEFLLTKRVQGAVPSSTVNPLSKYQQRCIDFQIGRLIHQISTYQSPTGQFGIASAVLEADTQQKFSSSSQAIGSKATNIPVYNCWSDAFLSLLESVLRDAEDIAVSLQYEKIRQNASRFKHVLDEVTVPSLVVLDAGEPFNTQIVFPGDSAVRDLKTPVQQGGATCFRTEQPEPAALPLFTAKIPAIMLHAADGIELKTSALPMTMHSNPDIPKVIGIQDWHNCIFGDPMFTSVLTHSKNTEIRSGFIYQLGEVESKALEQAMHLAKDLQHVDVRRLLYECYHSVAIIVTEYYRMTVDGDDRELPARRRLVQALARLEDLDVLGRKVHPRPDSAHSVAKRQKSV